MKTIDWNIGNVIGFLEGMRINLNPLTCQIEEIVRHAKVIDDAIESIKDIERWTMEAKVVMNSWDNVRKAVEDHPDTRMNDGIAYNALKFIKRDADNQRKIT